ncbi:spore germination protein [Thermoactinomyces sp. CICC 10521]|nr:spore germination protein [Thermoactinomyces sp. CICC 10521]
MQSLMFAFDINHPDRELSGEEELSDFIANHILTIENVKEVRFFKDLLIEIARGNTALFIDGLSVALVLGTQKYQTRSIEEPISEALVRGPRSGFNESLDVNIALLRQGLTTPDLTLIEYTLGRRTRTKLVVAFMKGIADPEIVSEVKQRLNRIDVDEVLESGYVEQLIEDNPFSPFPQIQYTERPDRVIAALLEGRVAILLEGTSFVLMVPTTFPMLLQSPEDYYERWIPTSLLRLMRYLAAYISLLLPSIYISFVSFHQGLIPTKLAISMAQTREGVPFPSFIEALIMEISIEILREAGLRLPKPVGQTVGLVGGLVVGEAAVSAGIISPIMVIVVSLTAISSFAIPNYGAGIALRLLRFLAMFSAALFGLYGVILFFLAITIHLCRLESFGVPYVAPTIPYSLYEWKDFIIRFPLRNMKQRPKMMNTKNPVRKK